MSDCIFCKIIDGSVQSEKIVETDLNFVFMDAFPLSEGHCLFIPKEHAEKLHDVSTDALTEIPQLIKKVAIAAGFTNYNILQNNGKEAGQSVFHAHFHLIPKSDDTGLKLTWEPREGMDQKSIAEKIRKHL